jgi:hypothetical protein
MQTAEPGIPKGMYGVYVLSCPIEYRSVKTLARFGSAVKDGWIPFIVGYGQRHRARAHWKHHTNSHEARIIRKMKMDDVPYRVTLSLITPDVSKARAEERKLIAVIGRTDLGTGPLTNKNEGGEGGPFGPETRAKISRSKQEWSRTKQGQAHIRKMHAVQSSLEGRAILSRSARKRMTTAEGRAHLQNLYDAQRRPEALAKMSRTKRKWYSTKEGQAAQRKLVEAARTPQARIKIRRSWQRRLKTDEWEETRRKMVVTSQRPDARLKWRRSMKQWAATEAGQETIARVAAAQRAVTPQTAAIIRLRLATGETQVALAKEFGVSPRTIRRIRKRGY